MANKIVLSGVPPYDGEYEFEGDFTMRELHVIKRITGLRAGELMDALAAVDTDVVVALAVIVLKRHGVDADENVLWDSEAGAITLVPEDEGSSGDDVGPPVEPAAPSESGGGSSSPGSDIPGNDQSPTGDQPSGMSATSAPVTSGS